jgi:maleate isomerase
MRRSEFLFSAGAGALGASIGVSPAWAQTGRWEPDGAGTVARFGVLTPDFDPVPESELWSMAPRGFSIHAARMARSGPGPAAFAEPPIADEAVDRLVPCAPRAILFGYTGSGYTLGAEAERLMRARLERRSKGVPVIPTCQAAAAALQLLGARRLSLVHPPWFSEATNDKGAAYWRAAGFEVVQCVRVQPDRSFTEVSPTEVFEFVMTHTPAGADAVFIGGNGLRAVGTIRALEARLRRPVLSANQVLMWEALRAVGQTRRVSNYGSLFRTRNATR